MGEEARLRRHDVPPRGEGFMIQSGDPLGTGSGRTRLRDPRRGLGRRTPRSARAPVCMANRGPNTSSMQFFVMDSVAAHLDGGHDLRQVRARERDRDAREGVPVRGDRAVTPPKIHRVTIARAKEAPKAAEPAPAASAPKAPAPASGHP
ncbi:MAG: peptidylprolyl isomerase [Polyangiaceae bacterium]